MRTKMQSIDRYETFEEEVLKVLNKHATLKKKFIRANHVPYMTKNLRKAIMKRSQLENRYISNSTIENLNKYKNIKTFVVNYTRKKGKSFFLNQTLKILQIINYFGKP